MKTAAKPLRTILVRYTIVAAILFVLLAAVASQVSAIFLSAEISAKNRFLMNVVTRNIEDYLKQPMQDLSGMRNILEDKAFSDTELQKVLSYTTLNHPYFVKLQYADANGIVRLVAPHNPEFAGIEVSGQEYFQETFITGKPHWSPTFISMQLNQPVVALSIPAKGGVLTGFISPNEIVKNVQQLRLGGNSFITITDRLGTFIAHSDRSKVERRVQDGLFDYFMNRYSGAMYEKKLTVNDHDYIVYVDVINTLDWPVVIYQDTREVFAPVTHLVAGFGLFSLIVLGLGGSVIMKKIYQSTRTLNELVKTTKEIANGLFDTSLPTTGVKEIDYLFDSFNQMKESIRARQNEQARLNKELSNELAKNSRSEAAFRALIASTTGNIGLEFFDSVCRSLSEWVGADIVQVGVFHQDKTLQAISFFENGMTQHNVSMAVKGTPAEEVARSGFMAVYDGILSRFPADFDLARIHARGYIGMPIKNSRGVTIGVISALSPKPLNLPEHTRDVMEMVAARAAVEIEHKEALQQIAATLKEKEIMLREIHHRVKNNMQIVSGLLHLQLETIDDERAATALRDSSNRISAMSLIHQKLYQSANITSFSFRDYCNSLVGKLVASFDKQKNTISSVIDIDHYMMNIDYIIPLGLIINELITNSIKHAFPTETEHAEIFVSLKKEKKNQLLLRVGDNGVGVPKNLLDMDMESFGLSLVISLADQIEGTLSLDANAPGTCYELRFPYA